MNDPLASLTTLTTHLRHLILVITEMNEVSPPGENASKPWGLHMFSQPRLTLCLWVGYNSRYLKPDVDKKSNTRQR